MKTAIRYRIVGEKTKLPAPQLRTSADVSDYCRKYLYDGDIYVQESLYVLMFNNNLELNGFAQISSGAMNCCFCDMKILCRYVIEQMCSGVIIVHNHPSGKTIPSAQDKELCSKIKGAMSVLDIRLLDFLIITDESHVSFCDEGLI